MQQPVHATPVAADEHVYLTAHASLKDYLGFLSTEPVDPSDRVSQRAGDDWRAAREHLQRLEEQEAGCADNPPVLPVPPLLESLVAQVRADPIFQRAFAVVPSALGFVELDRLVARHKTLNLAQVQRVRERLGPTPSLAQIFRVCLPFDHPLPDVRMARTPNGGFVFASDSNDLRMLETVRFEPGQISHFQALGPMVGVAGVVVGFGSNYLNAIASDRRLVLNNGHHRACALRELGLTHAPCVIQKVATREELNVVGAGNLLRHPEAYLEVPRPPLVKDYFDPKLRTVVRLLPMKKHIKVHFTVEETELPG